MAEAGLLEQILVDLDTDLNESVPCELCEDKEAEWRSECRSCRHSWLYCASCKGVLSNMIQHIAQCSRCGFVCTKADMMTQWHPL